MNSETTGGTHCTECRGIGKTGDGKTCSTCQGTGLVAVVKESTTLSHKPMQPARPKRRFPRYYTDLPVKLRDQQEHELAGRCVVIAEGGLAAVLPEPVAVGSVGMIQLQIPTQPAVLEAWVVVRNQVGLRHGFEFVSLTASEREAIKQFCSGLMRQSEPLEVHS